MLESITEKTLVAFEAIADYVWESFEKDMQMTEKWLARTESIFAALETKVPAEIRRFFSGNAR